MGDIGILYKLKSGWVLGSWSDYTGHWVDYSNWRPVLPWKGCMEAALVFPLFPGFCHCAFLYDSEAMSQATTNGSFYESYKCFLFKLYLGYLWQWWKVYSQVGLSICKGDEQGSLDCGVPEFPEDMTGRGYALHSRVLPDIVLPHLHCPLPKQDGFTSQG